MILKLKHLMTSTHELRKRRQGQDYTRKELATLPKDPTAPFQYRLTGKQRAFLIIFSACNSVAKAAAEVGINPLTHSMWVREDEEYKQAYLTEAIPAAEQHIQDKAMKLAYDGWHDGVYYEGKKVGKKWNHDSGLAQMLLKGSSGKYRDGTNVNVAVPIQVNLMQGAKDL